MLDPGRDDVPPRADGERVGCAAQGEIVGLGPAAREHDLRGVGVEERRQRVPGVIELGFGPLPEGVDRRRVAKRICKDARHRADNFRQGRRGGVVIEIDTHGFIVALPLSHRKEKH